MTTKNNIYRKRFKKIKDTKVRNAVNLMFFLSVGECVNLEKEVGGSKMYYMNNAFQNLTLEEISWSNFANVLRKRQIDLNFSISVFELIYFLIDQNLYLGDYIDDLARCKEYVLRYASSISKGFQEKHFDLEGFEPSSILFYDKKVYSEVVVLLYPTVALNAIFQKYFNEYDSVRNNLTKCKNDEVFFKFFSRSLGNFVIETLSDFNDSTFKRQLEYFVNLGNTNSLSYLLKFYVYVQKA